MTSARRSFVSFFCAASLFVAACGGAPEPKAPKSMAAEPGTVEEAQAQIARARVELGGDATSAADAAPATPPPPPAPQAAPTAEDQKKTMESAPSGAAESPCSSPCRALASMRRAVTALCRMTGDEDDRCRDARKTLQSSEARVTPCSC